MTREETDEARRTKTDERGRFSVPELPSGSYRIDVRQSGFGPFVGRVDLTMNQEFWLRVPLQVGDVLQAVDVTAPFMPVDRYSPALHTFIDDRQVTGLPLDGRNFLELALLAPGTVPAPQGSASSSRGDFAFSVNGAREDFNGFLLDGVYNIDPKLNTPGVRPPVDAIREFQVLTSTYDASFGRNAGGQVNVITKSGANTISGSAYEFFRNGALASRNHFAPDGRAGPRLQPPPVRRLDRRPDRAQSHVLLRRLRAHAPARRRDARHQRPDASPSARETSRSRCSPSRSTSSSGSRFPAGSFRSSFRARRGARSPRCTPSRTAARRSPTSCPRRPCATTSTSSTRGSISRPACGRSLTARYSFSDRRLLRSVRGPGVRPRFRASAPTCRAAGRTWRRPSRTRRRPRSSTTCGSATTASRSASSPRTPPSATPRSACRRWRPIRAMRVSA